MPLMICAYVVHILASVDIRMITVRDEDSEAEERFVTIATDALGRLLVIVYSWREEGVRLISARKATRRERKKYEA
jgi:uncharacterized protein